MRIKKILRTLGIFALIAVWFLTGWLHWQDGRIVTETRVVYAGNAGPTNCGTGIDDSSTGSVSWTTPGNACTSSQTTTATGVTSSSVSHYLKVTNFGFSIPTGSTIKGIQVTVTRSTTANKGNRAIDNAARIVKGGSISSTDRSNTSNWATSPVTYGSTSDLWGETWTVADINASTFGFALSAKSTGTNTVNATVDAFVAITVTYNESPALSISQPDGTSDTVIVGDPYNITYTLSDPEEFVTAAFYYDTDNTGLNGTAISGACASAFEGTGVTCSWNTTGVTPGSYYVYGIANDGVNPQVSTYSPGQITINTAAVVSVSVSDGIVTYGTMPANTAKTTLSGELNDMQTATNDGNVAENFNIKGQNAAGGGCTWTLASTNGSDQYVHQFCNATDSSCASPPTNYTSLTTTYQTLKTGVASAGKVNFYLRLTTPNPSSCFGQQSADITIQAVQQ